MCSLKYHQSLNHFIFLFWFFTTVQIKWESSPLFIVLFVCGVNIKSMSGPWIEDWNSSDDILINQPLCFCFTWGHSGPICFLSISVNSQFQLVGWEQLQYSTRRWVWMNYSWMNAPSSWTKVSPALPFQQNLIQSSTSGAQNGELWRHLLLVLVTYQSGSRPLIPCLKGSTVAGKSSFL